MQPFRAILLIDENPNDAAFLSNLLSRHQVQAKISPVTDAAGFAALDERMHWDVVVVGARSGGMDVHELLPAVRGRWNWAKIVLVFAAADEAFAAEVLRQGQADFIAAIRSDLRILEEAVLGALAVAAAAPGHRECQRLLACAPAGFFRCSAAGHLFDCNDALARMLGFEDRVQPLLANWALVRAEHLRSPKLRALRPGGKIDLRLEHREGKTCWGRLHLRPLVLSDAPGVPVGYEGWVQDVTQRRWHLEMLRQHRETYHTLLDFSPVATAILGTDGVLRQVNNEFERLAGFKQAELQGRADYFSFVAPKDIERVKKTHQARIAGKNPPSRYEYDFVNRSGEVRRIQLTAHFVASRRCTVAQHIDLTDRQRKEMAFKELAMGLAEDWPDLLAGWAATLARALQVESVILAQATGAEQDRLEMQAGWVHGRARKLPSMPVVDSVFAKLLTGRAQLAVCTEKARQTHATDAWLQAVEAEAFVGLPVVSAQKTVIGVLAVVSRQTLGRTRFIKTAMQIVAQRAATELTRRANTYDGYCL